jgi:predicted ATP-binding protein involved in virulence
MPITSLHFTNVGPFDDIAFEFDPQVNVFTGPNNSGKSTALWVLADAVVLPFEFPQRVLRAKQTSWDIQTNGSRSQGRIPRPYSDDYLASAFKLARDVGYTAYIAAIRLSTDFRAETPIPKKAEPAPVQGTEKPIQWTAAQSAYAAEWTKRSKLGVATDSLVGDQVVLQKMIELDYRAYRLDDPSVRKIVSRTVEMASEITEGFSIKFIRIGEDERGLFPQFKTPGGDVPVGVLSQGTQSIIQWLAHLLFGYAEYYGYPPNLEEKPGILIIDEIDAHLHPSWQRRIIPTLTKYFPNLQIFCSTHSPLMLAGLKAGQVQLLRRDENNKVTVSRNEQDIIGWSADEILRTFLDVPSPTDLGTVRHLERLQQLERKENLSAEETQELEQLRHTVNRDLLSGRVAAQVDRLAEMFKQAKAEFAAHPRPFSSTRAKPSQRRRKPAG